jgi:hypothetical protein
MSNRLLTLILLLLPMACTPEDEIFAVRIGRVIALPDVPSGSALSLVQEDAFIVGDDSPYLFRLAPPYDTVSQRYLLLPEFAETARIPKPLKPDWESVAVGPYQGQTHLFVFGSGAKSPERDSLLVLNPLHPDQQARYSLTALYDRIVPESQGERASLNLEGAVVAGEALFLFNRGDNGILRIGWQDFIGFLAGQMGAQDLKLERFSVSLPQIDGKEARFSDACPIPGENALLFTATVENTANWIDDGEILGSYVGLLSLQDLPAGSVSQVTLLLDQDGEPIKDKVESIAVRGVAESKDLLALAVTDNDDGTSKLLDLQISRRRP